MEITNIILKKYPKSKILYITPIPTTNKKRDNFNNELKNKLISKFDVNDRIDVLDVGTLLRENSNWAEIYLTGDGLHQNPEGVKKMVKVIGDYFNNK